MTVFFFIFNATATPDIYPLSLHDALPISLAPRPSTRRCWRKRRNAMTTRKTKTTDQTTQLRDRCLSHFATLRSEEHTSELQSRLHLVCRLLLEKKKKETDAAGTSQLYRSQ